MTDSPGTSRVRPSTTARAAAASPIAARASASALGSSSSWATRAELAVRVRAQVEPRPVEPILPVELGDDGPERSPPSARTPAGEVSDRRSPICPRRRSLRPRGDDVGGALRRGAAFGRGAGGDELHGPQLVGVETPATRGPSPPGGRSCRPPTPKRRDRKGVAAVPGLRPPRRSTPSTTAASRASPRRCGGAPSRAHWAMTVVPVGPGATIQTVSRPRKLTEQPARCVVPQRGHGCDTAAGARCRLGLRGALRRRHRVAASRPWVHVTSRLGREPTVALRIPRTR